MSNLQPLVWSDTLTTTTIFRAYMVRLGVRGRYSVYYESATGEPATGFISIEDAKHWAEFTHYASEMQPYVKQDSAQRIENWFKKAKPEPDFNDYITQLGCHFEEIAEMMVSIGGDGEPIHKMVDTKAKELKAMHVPFSFLKAQKSYIDEVELLDSLCDQIVTVIGVGYMMGFDIQGALNEVIRSNDSKMTDGKFEFDDNGKIMKGADYFKPDLTPFVKEV